MSREYSIDEIKDNLSSNIAWINRALIVITEKNQTADEQVSGDTRWNNGIGWNGVDAKILTSFASQLKKGRVLSPKQVAIAKRKLPKYAKQVLNLIKEGKVPPVKKTPVIEPVMDISKLIKYDIDKE